MGLLTDILSDLGDEASRLGKQGAAELAAAIFNGQGFVQYGEGQKTPEMQREPEQAVEAPAVEPPVSPEPSKGMEL